MNECYAMLLHICACITLKDIVHLHLYNLAHILLYFHGSVIPSFTPGSAIFALLDTLVQRYVFTKLLFREI